MKFIRILFLMILSTSVSAEDTDLSTSESNVEQKKSSIKYDGYRDVTVLNETGEAIEFNLSATADGNNDLLCSYPGRQGRYDQMTAIDASLHDKQSMVTYLRGLTDYSDVSMQKLVEKTGYDVSYAKLILSLIIKPTKSVTADVFPSGKDTSAYQNVEVEVDVSPQMNFTLVIKKSNGFYWLPRPYVEL